MLRLRKQVDFWKEQAGLATAGARAAADLREISERRATPGPEQQVLREESMAREAVQGQQLAAPGEAESSVGVGGGCDTSTGGWSEGDGTAADEQQEQQQAQQ